MPTTRSSSKSKGNATKLHSLYLMEIRWVHDPIPLWMRAETVEELLAEAENYEPKEIKRLLIFNPKEEVDG